MTHPTTAPHVLLGHARTTRVLRDHHAFHAERVAELAAELAVRDAARADLIAAAWAACATDAERARLRTTISGIDPTFWEER